MFHCQACWGVAHQNACTCKREILNSGKWDVISPCMLLSSFPCWTRKRNEPLGVTAGRPVKEVQTWRKGAEGHGKNTDSRISKSGPAASTSGAWYTGVQRHAEGMQNAWKRSPVPDASQDANLSRVEPGHVLAAGSREPPQSLVRGGPNFAPATPRSQARASHMCVYGGPSWPTSCTPWGNHPRRTKGAPQARNATSIRSTRIGGGDPSGNNFRPGTTTAVIVATSRAAGAAGCAGTCTRKTAEGRTAHTSTTPWWAVLKRPASGWPRLTALSTTPSSGSDLYLEI